MCPKQNAALLREGRFLDDSIYCPAVIVTFQVSERGLRGGELVAILTFHLPAESVFELWPNREDVSGVREQILVKGDAELLVAVAYCVFDLWLDIDSTFEIGALYWPVEDNGEYLVRVSDLAPIKVF